MRMTDGVRQQRLQRVTAYWDDRPLKHAVMIPVFRADYRVFGMVGFTLGAMPLWYPGTPFHVAKRELRYKGSDSEAPPQIFELEPGHFEGAYYFDSWKILAPVFASQEAYPSLSPASNLASRKIGGWPIRDLIFEPPLHRLRGLACKGRFWGWKAISVLEIPALPGALDPYDEPAALAAADSREAGLLGRLLLADGGRLRLDTESDTEPNKKAGSAQAAQSGGAEEGEPAILPRNAP